QFTRCASTKMGNLPSYVQAAGHDIAIPLYEMFCAECGRLMGRDVRKGVFGADMQVALVNDGPVTIVIDSRLRD
ncbi:MAG: D-aminoacyl-tRNA deacylase, partial [Duncaniella sp.]|nr:D-aminoacyl-tRNA deacylase [Duncaniella sp.]